MIRSVQIPIRGMDCGSCASRIRGALERVDGVVNVEVLLAAEKAVVDYDERRTARSVLEEAVVAEGYSVSHREGSSTVGAVAGDGSARGDDGSPAGAPAGAEAAGEDGAAGADGGARSVRARRDAERLARRSLHLTGLVFGAVLVVVILGEWAGLFEAATERVPFSLGIVVVAVVGWPAFRSVVRAAFRGRVISHTLMTVGVLAALVVGQWVTAAVVAFFMRVGDFVEGFTMDRGRRALRDLAALAPRTARVERAGHAESVPLESVRHGDLVVVRPGERIPVDGTVEVGRAAVEQAAITGEAMPAEVGPGDRVFAATIARGGALRIRTVAVGEDATFGRIVRMVEASEANRGEVQSAADRFSTWYLPIVGTIAVLTFAIGRDPLATAAVLVVACSCAFALATPVAMIATIGASARRGLLVKGGAFIEALARADVVLLDKTGTLTTGRPRLTGVVSHEDFGADEVLRLAASAEQDSEHPLADAVRREAARRGLDAVRPERFRALEGVGVEATVEGRRIRVGSGSVAESPRRAAGASAGAGAPRRGGAEGAAPEGAAPEEASPDAAAPEGSSPDAAARDGTTAAYVYCDGAPVGRLDFADELREDVPAAVDALRRMGIVKIEMLTGDREGVAAPLAARLGIEHRAGLLPEDKIRVVESYQREGHVVVMIGDGVNDAPALARADVGIAMGVAGSDLALEVAHVALLRDDWSLVPEAFRVARRTMRVVKGNIGFAGLYNVVGLTLAAVGILPPILAAAAQSIPDLGILGNSARLLGRERTS